MGYYRVFSNADTFITDAHPSDTTTVRATGSNMGASPSLNVFSRKGDIFTGSIELARTLIKFDLTELSGLIYDEERIPSTGVQYYLRMFDLGHDDTVPTSCDLFAFPLSRSWDEGTGQDIDKYRDYGYANWLSASSTQTWTATGSDFIESGYGSGSQHLDFGYENLEMEITDVVKNWLTGAIENYGIVLKLGDTEEDNGTDYFRKAFHSRESKYVDRIPYIEARWSKVAKDHRGNFGFDVDNTLFMYNFIRGELTNVTIDEVRIQDNLIGVSASYTASLPSTQFGQYSTGIYTASLNIVSTASFSATFYDIWRSGGRAIMTGTFTPLYLTGAIADPYDEFVVNVNNLKRVYSADEEARIIVNVRKKGNLSHIGSIHSASLDNEKEYIEKMYWSIVNDESGETIVPFGTGSALPFTQMSYNDDGNYFNVWMNGLVPGFIYKFIFLIDINTQGKKIIDDNFRFKVI